MSTLSRPQPPHLLDHPAFESELKNFIERECQFYDRIDERPPFVVNRNSRLQGFSALRIDDSGKRTREKIHVEPRTWNDAWSVLIASIDDKKRVVQKAVGGSGGYSLRIWLGHEHYPTSKLIAKPEYEPSSDAIPQKKRPHSMHARFSSDSDSDSVDTPSLASSLDERLFEDIDPAKNINPAANDTNANPPNPPRSTRTMDEPPSNSDANRIHRDQDGHVSKRSRADAQALENMRQGIRDRKARQMNMSAEMVGNSANPSVNQPANAPVQGSRDPSTHARAPVVANRTIPSTSAARTHQDGSNAQAGKKSQPNADEDSVGAAGAGGSSKDHRYTAPAVSPIRNREYLLRKKLEHLEALQRSMNSYQDSMIALQKELIETDNQLLEHASR